MSRAWEFFALAIQELAKPGTPKDRLTATVIEYILPLRPKDLPSEVRKEFLNLVDGVHRWQLVAQRERVQKMLDAKNTAETELMIDSILAIHRTVSQYQPQKPSID